jgi:membrane protein implicated in regulation of membrane protease activity
MIWMVRSFGRFWYDFIVGDDWRIAVGVVVALAITAVVSHTTAVPTWWIVLAALAILLPMSIHRVARRVQRPPASSAR